MTDGFKAINQDGVFQIDGITPNFQLSNRQSGNTSFGALNTVYNNIGQQFTANYNRISFTFTGTSPLVAFRATDGARCCLWSLTRSGNTYVATFIADRATNITMWVLDQAQATNDNFGFKVYSPSGALVCSAIQPFAKIADVISGQYLGGTGWYAGGGQMPGNNVQTRAYGFKPAFAAVYPCHYMESTGDQGGGSTNMSGLMVNGNSIQWEFFTFAGSRSGNFVGFKETTAYRFMILDMTAID